LIRKRTSTQLITELDNRLHQQNEEHDSTIDSSLLLREAKSSTMRYLNEMHPQAASPWLQQCAKCRDYYEKREARRVSLCTALLLNPENVLPRAQILRTNVYACRLNRWRRPGCRCRARRQTVYYGIRRTRASIGIRLRATWEDTVTMPATPYKRASINPSNQRANVGCSLPGSHMTDTATFSTSGRR
jgi:hypothetical protein